MVRLISFAFVLVTLASCSEFNKRRNNETWASGKPGQVLVVCTDELWQSTELDSFFIQISPAEAPYYPFEYAFKFNQKNVVGFNSNYKNTRNILIIEKHEGTDYSPAQVNIVKNKWVKGQVVVEVFFNDVSDVKNISLSDLNAITEAFEQAELDRYVKHCASKSNNSVKALLEAKYGLSMDFPTGVNVLNDVDDFMRIDVPDRSREMPLDGGANVQTSKANFILSSVLIWQQDFIGSEQLSMLNLLAFHDTILKKYAPHEKEGAYLATEYDTLVYPISQTLPINGVDMVEIKGQYRIRGRSDVFMGGPFVSYSFVNPKTNKIVTVFGMVHGPSEPLLTYIREHKALLRTLKI
jgi:hypothetical protein